MESEREINENVNEESSNEKKIQKQVDESWKESVVFEKEKKQETGVESNSKSESLHPSEVSESGQEMPELNFAIYISSLVFQAMIFLGEIPNPLTNQEEKSLQQAKFIIDTLSLIKEKTVGNLTNEENEMLAASLYELQLKYVDTVEKEKKT